MSMSQDHRIYFRQIVLERLQAKFRSRIYLYIGIAHFHVDVRAKPRIARVVRSTGRAATANDRNSLRRASAEEDQFHAMTLREIAAKGTAKSTR